MTKSNLLFFIVLLFPFTLACTNKVNNIPIISTDLTTQLRAPAYPLVTVDPYFNAWSNADNLYDDQVRHWTGKEFPLVGAIRVDGETYRFMGKEKLPLKPHRETLTRTAQQTAVSVLPTQTIYSFDCGAVKLDLIFTTPLLLDDLDLMSRPVSYVSYQVQSKDDAAHDVKIYFEATPQWAVNEENQSVTFERIEKEGFTFLKTGTEEQPILAKKGDDIRLSGERGS